MTNEFKKWFHELAGFEYLSDHIKYMQRRLDKMGLEEKNKTLSQKASEMYAYVEEQEFNYLELCRQKDLVSPRAIEQGWLEELEVNISDHRSWITKYKLECLFDTGIEQRGVQEEYEKRTVQIKQAEVRFGLFAKWREEELEGIWSRQSRFHSEMEGTWKRRAIAAERRKWACKFLKPSGKPDKLRRPGRPWDKSAYAGPEKDTFCGGAANLFAYMQGDKDKLRVGSNESIDALMQKLQLQSYQNQVQQYEALLKPLMSNMQMAMTDGKDQVAMGEEVLEDFNMKKSGESPRWEKETRKKNVWGEFEDDPNDDPSNDPFFKTDEEKKRDAEEEKSAKEQGRMVDYKTPEQRALERKLDKRRAKYRKPVSRLPWSLLDELQGEKDKLLGEKVLAQINQMQLKRKKEHARKEQRAALGLDENGEDEVD